MVQLLENRSPLLINFLSFSRSDTPNMIRSAFKVSTPIPTTSMGFVLTQMRGQSSQDRQVTIYHSDKQAGTILVNYFDSYLKAVEKELNMATEFSVINIVYIPNLPVNVLIKRGLIFIGPEMIPVQNSLVHSREVKDIQKEVLFSVYSLFMGQLVGIEWWSDQWMTLGLSRYFAATSQHLPFNAEDDFVVDVVQKVVREHDPYTGKWISQGPVNVEEINNPLLFVVDARGELIQGDNKDNYLFNFYFSLFIDSKCTNEKFRQYVGGDQI